jgi:hypothetical protein
MARPKIADTGESGFANRYGVNGRFIRRFGVERFAAMTEEAREIIVNEHKRLVKRRSEKPSIA